MNLVYLVFPLYLIAAVQHLDDQGLSIPIFLCLFFPLTEHTPFYALVS